MSLPTPHPAFTNHFTDAIYDDPGLETAPFGSDEGSDMLWEWGRRRDELGLDSTVAGLMGIDEAALDDLAATMAGIDYLDQAAIIRGAVFTLLRLTGHLNHRDHQLALRTIDYEIRTTANPGWLPAEARAQLLAPLHRQRDDLLTWSNPGS